MQGKPISPRPTASTPAGCTSIFVLLLSFLAALARMFFLPGVAELLCWCGSAFAVCEPASRKVQRNKKSSARVKANKVSAPTGHRPSLGRSHVIYLLAAFHLCVSTAVGYSHAPDNASAHLAADHRPARTKLFASVPGDPATFSKATALIDMLPGVDKKNGSST